MASASKSISKAPVPQRPRYTKGARTKRRIVDTALELFAQRGSIAVSVRDIAAAVGMSHAGVLAQIGSKDELLVEILRQRDATEAAAQARERVEAGDIVGFVHRLLLREVTQPQLVALYTKLSSEATNPDHPAHDFFVERYQRLRESARSEFAAYRANHPEVLYESPEIIATQALALIDGLQVQWLLDPSVDMERAFLAWLDTIGVRRPSTESGAPSSGPGSARE